MSLSRLEKERNNHLVNRRTSSQIRTIAKQGSGYGALLAPVKGYSSWKIRNRGLGLSVRRYFCSSAVKIDALLCIRVLVS
jgi:hypothetical protein